MVQILCQPETMVNSESNMPEAGTCIQLSSTVVCAEENLCCNLQGEAVVLNLKSGTYFGLNPLGTRIWELIGESAKVSDVHLQLLKEYEVNASQCEAELLSFLNELQANDLIKIQVTPKD